MAQDEIRDYLNYLRLKNDNKYYTVSEIYNVLGGSRGNIAKQIIKLYNFGTLEIKYMVRGSLRGFRLKRKYIGEISEIEILDKFHSSSTKKNPLYTKLQNSGSGMIYIGEKNEY